MSLHTFTVLHVIISLIGIVSGLYVLLFGLLRARLLTAWNAVFWITTVATSVTGFLFPFKEVTPAIGVGLISLAVLIVAAIALYQHAARGPWRWIYVANVTIAVYFNVFVAVAQAFQKIPPLHALAPSGTEPAFIIAQLLLLGMFAVLGVLALKQFQPTVPAATLA
jgi:hypothetical protein